MAESKPNAVLPTSSQTLSENPSSSLAAATPSSHEVITTGTQQVAWLTVKFEKAWGVYNQGELAGFEPDRADWLITQKIAVKA